MNLSPMLMGKSTINQLFGEDGLILIVKWWISEVWGQMISAKECIPWIRDIMGHIVGSLEPRVSMDDVFTDFAGLASWYLYI